MSAIQLFQKIKALPVEERDSLFCKILLDPAIEEELERIAYLRLAERSFDFWNDPREDIYQEYS
ncbi:MAG: hypothetical protein HYZ34_02545 [Ignavibacteriae bacterium]|nr:hypothetical protein [Ignavibacteriota bacterium]